MTIHMMRMGIKRLFVLAVHLTIAQVNVLRIAVVLTIHMMTKDIKFPRVVAKLGVVQLVRNGTGLVISSS